MDVYDFLGVPSGDHACFCWAVDAATFERLEGRKPEKGDEDAFVPGHYKFYPPFRGFIRRRFRITVEDVG